jgi:hypothetical protein
LEKESVIIQLINDLRALDVEYKLLIIIVIATAIAISILKHLAFVWKRKQRRKYYREEYLNSEEWQRKRYIVLKRDNWRCVYCGEKATQVHHKKYSKRNIGKEPIRWLVSVCKSCHESLHH